MTSETGTAYVWIWLPGATEPVVCGRLDEAGDLVHFTYGRGYLTRADAVPVSLPELPLRRGSQAPPAGCTVAGCITDAGPDAWGRRVIEFAGLGDASSSGLVGLLLASGSNRTGALDFQASSTRYVPRGSTATLAELMRAAEAVEAGEPLHPELQTALVHGTSVGGARPKATVDDGDRSLIAKFSSSSDLYPVVRAEAATMWLAAECGIEVAPTEIVSVAGRDVLLVERFDRAPGGTRRMVVSAATLLELPEDGAWRASYVDLAEVIRARFTDPVSTLAQLFRRIVFNVCVSNTDDHARNHAAFYDGATDGLALTPAFDLCPQPRSGGFAKQAMTIGVDDGASELGVCVRSARHYLLDAADAADIVDEVTTTIRERWSEAADHGRLTGPGADALWGRQILNPAIFVD